MFEYFFYSLAGTIWLLNLMVLVIGSAWVLVVAFNELLISLGVTKWKNYGLNALKPKRTKSDK